MNNELLELERMLKYDQLVLLWKEFCNAHTTLYDLTCEEYIELLDSNIDSLESVLKQKELVLERISSLELTRQKIIQEINDRKMFSNQVLDISTLLSSLEELEQEKKGQHLRRFNELLVDIIERVQVQNKKNQIFLNKAMMNLREIRESFTGKKKYQTYGPQGVTK